MFESQIYQRYFETKKTIEYEKIGTDPRVLFFSGIHGDEGKVINPIRSVLNGSFGLIPDNLGIFWANKKALKKRKRKTSAGDLNRHFNEEYNFRGVRKIVEVFNQEGNENIEYVFSFHEETDKRGYDIKTSEIFPRPENSFYIYDAYDKRNDKSMINIPELNMLLTNLTAELENIGIVPYTGLDDSHKGKEETVQDNVVTNGYCPQPIPDKIDGTFENWVIGKKKIKRSILFEIPSHVSADKKQEMIEVIFNTFIIPFLKTQLK